MTNMNAFILVLAGAGVLSFLALFIWLVSLIVPAKVWSFGGKVVLEILATAVVILAGALVSHFGAGLVADKLMGLPWSWLNSHEPFGEWQWLILLTGGVNMFLGTLWGYATGKSKAAEKVKEKEEN